MSGGLCYWEKGWPEMKSLRALFWGVLVGVLVGNLRAPRGADVTRALAMEKERGGRAA